MKKVIVICAGGFGREVASYVKDAFQQSNEYTFASLQNLNDEETFSPKVDEVFVVAHGDPLVKKKLITRIEKSGGQIISVIHPKAYVDPTATIGRGAIITPFCYVGPDAVLEPFVTLNIYSACGHDAKIGSYTVLNPYAFLAGNTTVSESVFFGAKSFVMQGSSVGEFSKVSVGSMVHQDVPAYSLAFGSPAKSRVMYKPKE